MEIEDLIEKEDWENIALNIDSSYLASHLPFNKGLKLAYSMLYNSNDIISQYSVNLLEAIRAAYPDEWNASWEHDAFLGQAYDFILKYDERYEAFLRAFEKIKHTPPPFLLINLAGCVICPGPPPLSYEKAIEYLNMALEKYLYVDGVNLMRIIYGYMDEIEKEKQWEKVLNKIKDSNKHSSFTPYFAQK